LPEGIYVYGAREHNLKSINAFIPHNKITVVTGLSGSGKSSLVFDTIYAEGQRRYVESLSSYARFFISKMKKPDIDSIIGLSPAVAINQKSISHSPRSTVGTVTETYDYLRLLFAKLGTPYCIKHNQALESTSIEKITKEIMSLAKGTRFFVLAPIAQGKKGEFLREFESFLSAGYHRARINGSWLELPLTKKLSKRKDHYIDLLMDHLVPEDRFLPRLKEGISKAIDLSNGFVKIEPSSNMENAKTYSITATCPVCLNAFPELEPKLFSFNKPSGACTYCYGLGYISKEEKELTIEKLTDKKLTKEKKELAKKEELEILLNNSKNLDNSNSTNFNNNTILNNYIINSEDGTDTLSELICPHCEGKRLQPFALNVKIKNKNIADLSALSIDQLIQFFSSIKFPTKYQIIADKIVSKIKYNLSFLKQLGLGYLTLNRPTKTLSGGEAQRIRLMSQISSPLIGLLYVLDEPSIGLHPVDHERLLKILFKIRDRGNTVLIVEHDKKTIQSAEHIIDLGPLAGKKGGEIIAKGNIKDIIHSAKSVTGQYLSGKKRVYFPTQKKQKDLPKNFLEIKGAKGNNLKALNVKIPLSCLVGLTGVSGSGKSSLIIDTLYKALIKHFNNDKSIVPLEYQKIMGLEHLDKVIAINQKPIGRTSRSVPATYIGIMSLIRNLMAQVPTARINGYKAGDFSFNIKGGRCEQCAGTGQVKQEMFFLPSAILPCDICHGRRYSEDILNILYKNKNIDDILNMDVSIARKFFSHHIFIEKPLSLLEQVGLGYLALGQSSTTLSGGEAQRIKLTRELAKKNTKRTLYILDEPTTGLHFKDIEQLLFVLKELVNKGSTVILIEHNLDVIKSCDHIIDLGPGGGKHGGKVVAEGSPKEIIKSSKSITGSFLKKIM